MLYFKNDSMYYEDGKDSRGYALISTPVGALGFLVLESSSDKLDDAIQDSDDSNKREININHPDEVELYDLGLMYGSVVFRYIQREVYISNDKFSQENAENNTKEKDSLITQINDYIPFGHNRCISVFIDIRGLSALFNGNRKHEQLVLDFIHEFSEVVGDASRRHYGMITSHFGGGMLITFNQVIREELSMSCFRAICAMKEIKDVFNGSLRLKAKKLFGEKKAEKITIAMGASAGEAVFSTLGCNPTIFYTGMGRAIGFAKKIENISERDEVEIDGTLSSCIDKIFISDEVLRYCGERESGIDLTTIETAENIRVAHSKANHKFHHVGDVVINKKGCPLEERRCEGCPNTIKGV